MPIDCDDIDITRQPNYEKTDKVYVLLDGDIITWIEVDEFYTSLEKRQDWIRDAREDESLGYVSDCDYCGDEDVRVGVEFSEICIEYADRIFTELEEWAKENPDELLGDAI